MTYSLTNHNDCQVLAVSTLFNEIDNLALLRKVEEKIKNGYAKVIVDLKTLDFMNSVGINFLLNLLSRSKKWGGDLALVNLSDQVSNVLEVTKLKPFFFVAPSIEIALSKLK